MKFLDFLKVAHTDAFCQIAVYVYGNFVGYIYRDFVGYHYDVDDNIIDCFCRKIEAIYAVENKDGIGFQVYLTNNVED